MTTDTLAPHHLEALRQSAINDEVIEARGYYTITDNAELRELGFAPAQRRSPGLLLPLWTTDGQNGLNIYRPDNPRVIEQKRKGKLPDGTYPNKIIKYEVSKGAGTRIDCPPGCLPKLGDPSIALWITEGQKKADSLASADLCAIALLGVWNSTGRNKHNGKVWLPDWDHIALNGRAVRIVFDSDVMRKRSAKQALDRLMKHLQRKGASVDAVYLPSSVDGDKLGVDDWLAAGHTVDELEALVEAPRPSPLPVPSLVELLDAPPPTLRRPLALIEGRAFAVTWLYIRKTIKETLDKEGEIIRHDPPIIKTDRELFVVRDDGLMFGDGGDKPISDLGLELKLPEIPPADKLWSATGVKGHRTGRRADPADIFRRVTDVVDRFIDFDRSLAEQRVMAEAIACYCFSTWLLDAFNVIGFLWPNGDRGSGKTHLLLIIAELSYLGQVILAGGSYATLRDLADYGATLAFDDAENLSDPRKSDPDKRALLLAGNRRGATVTVKELASDKKWNTRYVDAFCPRLFSAIRLPDYVLASRTIIIPLIRTPDRRRANADPLDYETWPHDRRKLTDDLWALAVEHLPELPEFDKWVGQNAKLTGRNLQPWRALLAVAAWLESSGVTGLWERMELLSVDYQKERPDLETSDFTTLVIRALLNWLVGQCANQANCANLKGDTPLELTSAQVANEGIQIARDTEGGIPPDKVTPQRVGQVFKKMRLTKPPRPGGKGPRIWVISPTELIKWATTYGLPIPDELMKNESEQSISPVIGTIGDIGTLAQSSLTNDDDTYEGRL